MWWMMLMACGSSAPTVANTPAPAPAPVVKKEPVQELLLAGTAQIAEGVTIPEGAVVYLSIRSSEGGPPVAAKKMKAEFPLTFEITTKDLIPMGAAKPLPTSMNLKVAVDGDGNPMTREKELPMGTKKRQSKGTKDLNLTLMTL